jgi:signal transduction histidine kinase
MFNKKLLRRLKLISGKIFYFLRLTRHANVYQLRTDIVQRLSHEMRTTLTNIIGYSEFIENKAVEPVLGFTAKMVKESGADLVRHFQSFYDLVQLEAGETERNLMDVEVMLPIREVIRAYQIKAFEYKVRIILTRYPEMDFLKIRTDVVQFRKMLEIITFSVLQYLPPKSTLSLHVDYDEMPGFINLSFLEAEVSPDRPDIEFLSKFWKDDKCPPLLMQQGPGIELALAKALLSFLKGHAVYCYEPNVGINFKISIPIQIGKTPNDSFGWLKARYFVDSQK